MFVIYMSSFSHLAHSSGRIHGLCSERSRALGRISRVPLWLHVSCCSICCLTLKLDFPLFYCRKCNSSLWQWLRCDRVAASPPSSDHHCHHHHSLPGQEQVPGASGLWEWNPHSCFTTLCKFTGKSRGRTPCWRSPLGGADSCSEMHLEMRGKW